LCVPRCSRPSKRLRELIELNVIGVLLCRVRPRLAHERLKRDKIPAAFTQESICETVPQLVRSQPSNARALAHATNHSHEGLITRRLLWILEPALPLKRRHPLFDLDCENVVVQLGLKNAE
jgi:hypothetical protein